MTEDVPRDSFDRMHRVTKLLATQRTLPAKLEAVVALVERTTPNCDAAGIMLLIDGEPSTAAVSDRLAVEIDLVQYTNTEGPCLSAMRTGHVIRIQVLASDSRFTRFAPGALDHRIESVLSIPLITRGEVVGALNLYSHVADAFDDATEDTVRPMADYAAEAIGTSPLYASAIDMVEGLVETMEGSALVNRAVGVIMAGEHRTGEQALDRLRELARASGETLPAVAGWVLEERPTTQAPASEHETSFPEEP